MPLKFDKTTEDRRGKIIWLSSELTKINIVEIRSGFARGGHYHNHETTHFVISGKIEYREKNIDTGEEKTEIVLECPLSDKQMQLYLTVLEATKKGIKISKNKLSNKNVCISFDDGLKCQFDIALPVLEDLKIKSFFCSCFGENLRKKKNTK